MRPTGWGGVLWTDPCRLENSAPRPSGWAARRRHRRDSHGPPGGRPVQLGGTRQWLEPVQDPRPLFPQYIHWPLLSSPMAHHIPYTPIPPEVPPPASVFPLSGFPRGSFTPRVPWTPQQQEWQQLQKQDHGWDVVGRGRRRTEGSCGEIVGDKGGMGEEEDRT